MTEFNPDAICVKCGDKDIEDKYNGEFVPTEAGLIMGYKHAPEYIKRTCKNCGYAWGEAPLKPATPVHDAIKEAVGDIGFHEHTSDAPDKPVIEVGDVVHFHVDNVHKDAPCRDGSNCNVERIEENNRVLLMRKDCFCIEQRFYGLTLIRKGAKVHEFGRVEIQGDRYMQINTNYPMPPNGNYLLTATEDKP